jgi:hypothetical protein
LIDANPEFDAYFAQSVQDLDALGNNIFEALTKCSGAIIFLHNRGIAFSISGEEWGERSSVWVNQEIAILAFRQHRESQRLPILVFKDEKVKIEGAMTSFIINPHRLADTSEVLKMIQEWLTQTHFPPNLDIEFGKKWEQLSDQSRQVSSCLIDLGGLRNNQEEIRDRLIAKFSLSNNDATKAIQKAQLDFQRTNLVEFERNKEGLYVFNIHPTWEFYLRREIAKWHEGKRGHN